MSLNTSQLEYLAGLGLSLTDAVELSRLGGKVSPSPNLQVAPQGPEHTLIEVVDSAFLEEKAAVERLRACLETISADLEYYWHWGDGEGGWLLVQIAESIRARGFYFPRDISYLGDSLKPTEPSAKKPKAKISRALAKAVFERDSYRCVTCGTHIDLSCDHIFPESLGGPTSLDNLQTMCRPCNSRKGANP